MPNTGVRNTASAGVAVDVDARNVPMHAVVDARQEGGHGVVAGKFAMHAAVGKRGE